MKIVKRTTASEAQTMELAGALAARLRSGDIIALEGPLGAGKTCFVRGLARGLRLDSAAVSSPTFIICQEYERDDRLTLAHLDAYRLRSADELETIGWDELLNAPDTLIAVEWPSRIAEAIPTDRRIDVALEHAGEHHRIVTISATGLMEDRLEDFDGQAAHESG